MSPATTAPVLTHARMVPDDQHLNGYIHTNKDNGRGGELESVGWVRTEVGATLEIGWRVDIQKDDKKKTWQGTITSGPNDNAQGLKYWTFKVVNKQNNADPTSDDTLTVTVTNSNQQTSPPIASEPQPAVIP
jgi:hypothetical protein